MYMFDLQSALQSLLIHIRYVHSSASYQWTIYKKYGGHESPSGYGHLLCSNMIPSTDGLL